MNLYENKMVKCTECGTAIGEIDLEAKVKVVLCNKCQNKKNNEIEPSYAFLNKRMIEVNSLI